MGRTSGACLAAAVVVGACSIDFERHLRPDPGGDDASLVDGGGSDAVRRDVGPDAPSGLAAPRPWAPFNGWDSGSLHASSAVAVKNPLRPTFRWHPVAGATLYRFQLAEASTFATPLVDEVIPETEHTPSEPLPVLGPTPFVGNATGRRYFWRVAACTGTECSFFSRAQYLDVGRLPNDYDGDGYSDLFVGAPREGTDGVGRVFQGSAVGLVATPLEIPAPTSKITDRRFASSAAAIDVNGDGFAELAVSAPSEDALYVFGSQHEGVVLTRTSRLDIPFGAIGGAVTNVGDVDGDGFDDLAVGIPNHVSGGVTAGIVHVYYGAGSGSLGDRTLVLELADPRMTAKHGEHIAGRGDVNGDGFADVAIGSLFHPSVDGTPLAGLVTVHHGGPGGLSPEPAIVLPAPAVGRLFGVVSLGDLDGDHYDDLVVGAPSSDGDRGHVFVYRGGPEGVSGETPIALPLPAASDTPPLFGTAVTAEGDLDGDGRIDLVIGAKDFSQSGVHDGAVFGYSGVAIDSLPEVAFANPDATAPAATEARFGEVVRASYDFDGNGFADVVVAARLQGAVDAGAIFVYYGAPMALASNLDRSTRWIPSPGLRIDNPSGASDSHFGTAIASALVFWRAEVRL